MTDRATDEIAVVGGGLVGSLLSVFLADRGHAVTVYEQRPDLREAEQKAGRSINLVLTRRGIRALERAGLSEGALELTVPVRGRMMHSGAGELAYQPYGRDETECNYSISRAGLNEFLVRGAIRRGVRFRFDSRLVGVDLDTAELAFENESRVERFEVRPAVAFGADGAGSALRVGLRQVAGFDESVEMLEHGYKELLIPAADGGGFRIERNALHIWPRGHFMLMALPNLDGSFTVTLYMPHRGDQGFDQLDSKESVSELFREHFPDAIELLPDLERAFFENPVGELGTVRCRPWQHGGRFALIGDAAHAIVPFFGQGMNAGFEDCTVLGDLLDRQPSTDWEGTLVAFEGERKANSDAIADMALENFVEMRDRVGDAAFLLRKQVEHRMEREFPEEYRSRYSMVMYSHIPFATALEVGRIQAEILEKLCEDLPSADALDLGRARGLVKQKLTPFLEMRGASLDY